MADKELRMRIGAAISAGLDDDTLDLVYNKLMDIEDAGKIALTAKIVFSVDEESLLEVSVGISGNFPISHKRIKLKSDGKQLTLWDTPAGSQASRATPETPPASEKTPPAKKVPAKKSASKAAKAPAKKSAAKQVAGKAPAKKRRVVPVKAPAKAPASRRPLPSQTAAERSADIDRTNTRLYRSGVITREEAEGAGLDVDVLDGANGKGQESSDETNLAKEFGGEVGDLTPEELAGLDDLV